MKNVELIRERIVRGQMLEMRRLRAFISMIDGNNDVLEQLDGQAGQRLLAGVTEYILTHLGHVTVAPASERGSRAARAAARAIGVPRGK